jgi:hypothetical protein
LLNPDSARVTRPFHTPLAAHCRRAIAINKGRDLPTARANAPPSTLESWVRKAMSKHLAAEPITIERLERGLMTIAYIITRHGAKYSPIFDRIERELIAMNSGQDPIARARRVLESYTVEPAPSR